MNPDKSLGDGMTVRITYHVLRKTSENEIWAEIVIVS